MEAYVVDWLNLLVRWLHLIVGIAWIGSSFYFVWLDNHLTPCKKPGDSARGALGELWSVHGGGFYHNQKYLTGPKGEPLTEDLHWFKWEAYTTWLSGMGLLAIIYWIGANAYLIDKNVMDLSPGVAVGLSIAFLVAGWLVYDTLCKLLGKNENLLAAAVFLLIMLASWALFHVFSARAAYIHVGAIIGTIMVANVFFVIIPGQRQIVADIRAGREPDPEPGIRGKQRSVHNTYFTLPVLFIMISNHYPMTYGHKHGWLILGVIMLAGVLIRQFFVLRHKGKVNYALPAAGVALLLAVAIWIAPASVKQPPSATTAAVSFAQIQPVIAQRCMVCHAEKPTQPGFASAPAGLMLDTPDRIKTAAQKIQQQAVLTQTMPIGNLTQMTPDERALLGRWIAAGARVD